MTVVNIIINLGIVCMAEEEMFELTQGRITKNMNASKDARVLLDIDFFELINQYHEFLTKSKINNEDEKFKDFYKIIINKIENYSKYYRL